ncbi:hypothetical protein [Cohnella silvisoli]|uniref:Uncharacterized protein n=1 Tax=Cohnella silvisoli TaxID=2873699 RepID=A0ABV1KYU8_9BACL|nr:hypothetical protein [Cohnella silvisoli]MCD9024070.1 hypothetical protein [Cohnella silvisoli]
MTTFKEKVTLSALAVTMLTASFGGLPLSQKGLAEKLGLIHVVNAAESELPSSVFLQRMNELYAALAAGDPADVQDVRNLRDEIAGLDESSNQQLLDPIWNKISAKLPATVDQAELKISLFRLVKAVGSFRYDPQASDLEAIRTNPEFRATLKTIAAAGGDASIKMDDFLVFLFGDGAGRDGVEGTIAKLLSKMSAIELFQLLGNKQGITAVLLQATEKLLAETGAYKFSSILANLGVTPQDVRATVLGFQLKLQKDEPAINAMTVAYIRSAAKASVVISDDGREHKYVLSVFGVVVPSLVLQWTKVSGSPDVSVAPDGTVTIPEGVPSASAVIQAKLINPYGGSAKVIFEKEVTLTAESGEETVFLAEQFLERMNKIHAALIAGDPADVQDVRNARDEIAGLDVAANLALIDPLWNKIAPKLPASVDKAKLKTSLFEIVKALGSFQYDPQASDLEAIRTNPEYRATLKTIGAAGGISNFVMDDFLVFMFGDGDSRKGVEGIVRAKLASLSPTELLQLLGNKQGITALLLQATEQMLGDTEAYKLSSILNHLGVTPLDVRATVLGFQLKLQKDEPAINAMTVALIRSEATGTAKISEDGLQHEYSLKVFGIDVPAPALQWAKVSGSPDVSVLPNGTVTIPANVASASAVIQAKLVNPYGGEAKVIFEQEVMLTATDGAGDIFPAEQFLERMNKIRAALLAGDPADAQAVRNLRDEIAGLNVAANQALIDPVWNRIALKLPASVDQAKLKASLFEIVRAVGSFQYDPQASDLEAIRTNPQYRATLKTIAAAAGVKRLTMDDYLIFLFGDGKERKGIEGTILSIVADMKPKEFADLLGNKEKINAVVNEAMAEILSEKEDYPLSAALNKLGVKSSDVRSTVANFQAKLKYDVPATNALTIAYIRSEAVSTVKITANGRHHDYGLTYLGVEIPSSVLKWTKVSGSKDVKVDSNGKVSIPNKVAKGTAVIQAALVISKGGPAKVVFQQEVTLVNGKDSGEIQDIIQALEDKFDEIKAKLESATNDLQKVKLLSEVVLAGKDTISKINKADAPKEVKEKAIKDAANQVKQTISLIIRDILGF